MEPLATQIERVEPRHGEAARKAALNLVLRGLPDDIREPFIAGLLATASAEASSSELWWAVERNVERPTELRLFGAVWSQGRSGDSAIIWPPQWTTPREPSRPDPLLTVLLKSLAESGVTLAQSLLVDRDAPEAAVLRSCGFEHVADLRYLSAAPANRSSPSAGIHFAPIDTTNEARLAEVVEQTYVGSLDCPSLNGLRRPADVLAEYHAIGTAGRNLWRLVERQDSNAGPETKLTDLGCLLLADHPSQNQLELVYMGIVPAARGRHFGEAVVREALRIAAVQGREQVVLAVDAANLPAVAIYERCGFAEIDRRAAFVCRLSTTPANS